MDNLQPRAQEDQAQPEQPVPGEPGLTQKSAPAGILDLEALNQSCVPSVAASTSRATPPPSESSPVSQSIMSSSQTAAEFSQVDPFLTFSGLPDYPMSPRQPHLTTASESSPIPRSPDFQVPQAVALEVIRHALEGVLQQDMSPRLRADLERLWVFTAGPDKQDYGSQHGRIIVTEPQITMTGSLEEVRSSFLEMAPSAFQYTILFEVDPLRYRLKLSTDQIVAFWAKIWDSFDLHEPQQIDFKLEPEEQPRDVKIFLAALDAIPSEAENKGWHKNAVPEAAAESWGPDSGSFESRVFGGADLLERMLRFKHGVQPYPAMSAAEASRVPFAWLDVRLSRFRHLGWRLLPRPDHCDRLMEYNDTFDVEDPLHVAYDEPSDHFEKWQFSGLLLTDIRVPLPRQLYRLPLALGNALENLYSRSHPLCLIEQAWRFALEFREMPTDADLRAAMVYQILFCLAVSGLPDLWRLLSDDPTLKLNSHLR